METDHEKFLQERLKSLPGSNYLKKNMTALKRAIKANNVLRKKAQAQKAPT